MPIGPGAIAYIGVSTVLEIIRGVQQDKELRALDAEEILNRWATNVEEVKTALEAWELAKKAALEREANKPQG